MSSQSLTFIAGVAISQVDFDPRLKKVQFAHMRQTTPVASFPGFALSLLHTLRQLHSDADALLCSLACLHALLFRMPGKCGSPPTDVRHDMVHVSVHHAALLGHCVEYM